jgi:nucleotide-binding universal stress UspA family protein
VLVATDGTPSSRAAVEKDLSMAEELGARVTFVSTYRLPGQGLESPSTSVLSARGSPWLGRLSKRPRRSAPMPITIVEGRPARAIARLAVARDADLVVVGSRDLTPPVAALRGSVSRSLVGQSDRAVLVAKDGRRGKSRALLFPAA